LVSRQLLILNFPDDQTLLTKEQILKLKKSKIEEEGFNVLMLNFPGLNDESTFTDLDSEKT